MSQCVLTVAQVTVCLLAISCCTGANSTDLLSRRKRYLNFPNKASVVMSITLLKNIASDYRVGPTVRVVTIHELDINFPLPHDPSPLRLTKTALGQPPIYQQHRRHRRYLYRQLEDALYEQGLEGKSCVMKGLCEAKKLPKSTEENLIEDLLYILFSQSQNTTREEEEGYQFDENDCLFYDKLCPLSIFDMALEWGHYFSSLYRG